MDDATRIATMLTATKPRLDLADLLLLNEPNATFEAHVAATDGGADIWLYTVNGCTIDGDCIMVRARLPIEAETKAQEGLRASITALKTFDSNTGLQADVAVRGLQ